MNRILAINGSYRDDGITDQAVELMCETARQAGADVDIVMLRDYPIEFCHNCRHCTQQPGDTPQPCVIEDAMADLVARIETADALILAAPVNFGSVTAVFKRFMERLVVYAYWPFGTAGPDYRKAGGPQKKAVLVSSSAAPGPMGWFMNDVRRQLRTTARLIGARPVGTLVTGLVSQEAHPDLPQRAKSRARKLAIKLL